VGVTVHKNKEVIKGLKNTGRCICVFSYSVMLGSSIGQDAFKLERRVRLEEWYWLYVEVGNNGV
jgi:hypothetical protein